MHHNQYNQHHQQTQSPEQKSEQRYALVVHDKSKLKTIKVALEQAKLFDKQRRISSVATASATATETETETAPQSSTVLVPVLGTSVDLLRVQLQQILSDPFIEIIQDNSQEQDTNFHSSKKQVSSAALKSLIPRILKTLQVTPNQYSTLITPILDANQFPARYQIYPPLLLFSASSFGPAWTPLFTSPSLNAAFFNALLRAVSSPNYTLSHVAENAPIADIADVLRRPSRLHPLYQIPESTPFDDLWVSTTQNGVAQMWAPAHTMFSRGNVSEKARVLNLAKLSVQQLAPIRPMAVDLYAGIGYFTFSYARASFAAVFCWDLNPWSIAGLHRGSYLNSFTSAQFATHDASSVPDKDPPVLNTSESLAISQFLLYHKSQALIVFQEDNQRAHERLRALAAIIPLPIAHINLGTLPSTELAWPTAMAICTLSSCRSVALHVHANVPDPQIQSWTDETLRNLQSLDPSVSVTFTHLERIKTYAPGIWHVCGDYLVTKQP
ncbi:uncharacterized protein SAPINGB_P003194 [Magnusiomyces paraingens]|uniref:tRNA(Phe) (4-demethylwyosine(37)-C(7)) aminocarboxypropyltransferase n=1 Tax=Magnusiomyces paraingens TaxID=2606893 RepID=A0A5E8BKD5_9ASCO|nr:uncharacterized protein SAPINGB_P003194 [Saprochaete ingens]VVT51731.1 unnamed protein product [Saprochaete ingens]